MGPRRLRHRHALPAHGRRRRSACRRAPSAWPGPRSNPATASSTSSLDVADEMRPRQAMTIPVDIGNLQPGDGGLSSPSPRSMSASSTSPTSSRRRPDDWYFGQRKLGMEIRDLYGLLIDRMQGVPGDGPLRRRRRCERGSPRRRRPRSSSPSIPASSRSAPDGKATVTFDMPRVQRHRPRHGDGLVGERRRPRGQGRDRPRSGRGHAELAAVPRGRRHLAAPRRDQQRRRRRPATTALEIEAGDGIGIAAADLERTVDARPRRSARLQHPDLRRAKSATTSITVSLTTPAGEVWPRSSRSASAPPASR